MAVAVLPLVTGDTGHITNTRILPCIFFLDLLGIDVYIFTLSKDLVSPVRGISTELLYIYK